MAQVKRRVLGKLATAVLVGTHAGPGPARAPSDKTQAPTQASIPPRAKCCCLGTDAHSLARLTMVMAGSP
jgi:hypothetical protein